MVENPIYGLTYGSYKGISTQGQFKSTEWNAERNHLSHLAQTKPAQALFTHTTAALQLTTREILSSQPILRCYAGFNQSLSLRSSESGMIRENFQVRKPIQIISARISCTPSMFYPWYNLHNIYTFCAEAESRAFLQPSQILYLPRKKPFLFETSLTIAARTPQYHLRTAGAPAA